MAVAQRRPEPLKWFREMLRVPGAAATVRVRRGRQTRQTEEAIAAAVLAALHDEPMPFLRLRRALGIDAALLARTLGGLAVGGVVELTGIPARWRLVGPDLRSGVGAHVSPFQGLRGGPGVSREAQVQR